MKKEILLSFLAGMVVPLVMAAFFQKSPAVGECYVDEVKERQTSIEEGKTRKMEKRKGDAWYLLCVFASIL